MCVCVRESVCEGERKGGYRAGEGSNDSSRIRGQQSLLAQGVFVCLCERERQRERVCVSERERSREFVCVRDREGGHRAGEGSNDSSRICGQQSVLARDRDHWRRCRLLREFRV